MVGAAPADLTVRVAPHLSHKPLTSLTYSTAGLRTLYDCDPTGEMTINRRIDIFSNRMSSFESGALVRRRSCEQAEDSGSMVDDELTDGNANTVESKIGKRTCSCVVRQGGF
jgi:hypothetical protein